MILPMALRHKNRIDFHVRDPETGTYIPYQQADGNGEAIGRGNGWYYYDDEAGAYIPW